MPLKTKKICNYPQCGETIPGTARYCPVHEKIVNQRYNRDRETAVDRGYSSRWQRTRKSYLKRHPICNDPECNYPATVVDHVLPHRGDKSLFWDKSNWQGLCKWHHDKKTGKGQ